MQFSLPKLKIFQVNQKSYYLALTDRAVIHGNKELFKLPLMSEKSSITI